MHKPSHQELKSISHKQLRVDALAELRKQSALLERQTTLLEVIAKQGDRQLDCIAGARPLCVTLASAADAHGLPG